MEGMVHRTKEVGFIDLERVEVEKRVSPLRRQSAPPPVEMTVFRVG
jgi:hypothetical protein